MIRRSPLAVRCAVLSTVALIAAIGFPGTLRVLFAFLWVVLCLCAMGFEMAHRRRNGQPIRRVPPGRRR